MHPCMMLDVCLMLDIVPFGTLHGILIAVIAVLLACSAFFSACETAFSSMNIIRIRTMAENKVKGARKALYIAEHSDRALTTILVGNNIVNILATTLCAFVLSQLLADAALLNVLNTVVMTIIILITGEILPKALAKANPEGAAAKLAWPLWLLMKLLYPVVIVFYGLQKLCTKKQKQQIATFTEDELESIIDTMEEEGVLEKDEVDLLQGTFKIKEATAENIMTHRVDVVFLDANADEKSIAKLFVEHQYSRLPVFKGSTDNIIGVLNIKDFLHAKFSGKEFNLENLLTPPLFTAENTIVDTLIKQMQKEKKHLAVVLDENGGVSGIVTMEDCLETVFGEIFDETDEGEEEPKVEQVGDDEYLVDAEISVEELFGRLQIEKLPENPYQTLNSFIFDLSQDIPQNGSVYEFNTIDEIIDDEGNLTQHHINMIFTVVKTQNRRIDKVDLKIVYRDPVENKDE